MDGIVIDPKLNYLLVEMSVTYEDILGRDIDPVVVVPLDEKFFAWVDARRAVVQLGLDLDLKHATFYFSLEFTNREAFDPDAYSPDGDDDIEDTKKMQEMLDPIHRDLESYQFAVVGGQTLIDCGLDPLERVEELRTSSEHLCLSLTPVHKRAPVLNIMFDMEEKHTYDPWDTIQVDYDELRRKYCAKPG